MSTEPSSPEPLETIGSLQEPQRRALYDIVVAHPDGVGREDAARAAGISRSLAAYHLDRLVEDGLLEVDYRRLTGRSGPGAGRPAKIYRRSGREFAVSLPPRDYELAARLLAAALEQHRGVADAEDLDGAVAPTAAALGDRIRGRARARGEDEPTERDLRELLAEVGYEPYDRDDGPALRLRNCPFHALTRDHLELMCSLNHALLDRMISAAGLDGGLEAELSPEVGHCCVAITRRP